MAWIESHQSLRDHRKTKRMARRLGIPRIYVVGHLHGVWWWALDNAPKGFVSDDDLPSIAEAAEWPGQEEEFVEAMVYAEFAERVGGGVVIHDWDEYAGKLLDQRKANAEKQKRWRDRHRDDAHNQDDELDNRNVTVTSPSRNPATVPNPTGPDSTNRSDVGTPQSSLSDSNQAMAVENAAHAAPSASPNGIHPREDKPFFQRYGERLKAESNKGAVLADAFTELFGTTYPPNIPRLQSMAKKIGGGEFLKVMLNCAAGYSDVDDPHNYLTKAVENKSTTKNGASNGHGGRSVDKSAMNGTASSKEEMAAIVRARQGK